MNEENTAASLSDAPAGANAPATVPTPEPNPAAAAAPAASASNTRSTSRFYSRFGRNTGAAPAAAQSQAASGGLLTEGLTPEQAVNLKDNLPVRATAGAMADAYGSEEGSGERRFSRDRERGERGGFDGERRGRGRDRDRGRNRDRDRERPQREEQPESVVPAAEAPVPETDIAPEATSGAPIPDATPAPGPSQDTPRRVRFEDVSPDEQRRTVQEFRPSRDRSYAEEAGRARREQQSKKEADPAPSKPSGLFGWMRSILGSKPEDTASDEVDQQAPEHRQDRQGRGPRRDSPAGQQGGPRQGAGEGGPRGEGGEGGGRRRRRRRGGRNRHRGEGSHGGGGAPRGDS